MTYHATIVSLIPKLNSKVLLPIQVEQQLCAMTSLVHLYSVSSNSDVICPGVSAMATWVESISVLFLCLMVSVSSYQIIIISEIYDFAVA